MLKLSSHVGLNFLDTHTLLNNEEHPALQDWRDPQGRRLQPTSRPQFASASRFQIELFQILDLSIHTLAHLSLGHNKLIARFSSKFFSKWGRGMKFYFLFSGCQGGCHETTKNIISNPVNFTVSLSYMHLMNHNMTKPTKHQLH